MRRERVAGKDGCWRDGGKRWREATGCEATFERRKRRYLMELHQCGARQLRSEPWGAGLGLGLLRRDRLGEEEQQGLRSHFPPSRTLLPPFHTLASSRGRRCSQHALCARKFSSSWSFIFSSSFSSAFCSAVTQKGHSHASASPGCSERPMQAAWNHSRQRSQHTRKAMHQSRPWVVLPSFMCGSPHRHPNFSCSYGEVEGLMGTIPEIARDLCSCSSEGVSLSMGVSLL